MRVRFAAHSLAALFALALGGACSSNDSDAEVQAQSVESFCEEYVSANCSTLSECCTQGIKFDSFECRRVGLASCLQMIGVEQVAAGQLRFDRDAAAACLVPASSCPSSATPKPPSHEQDLACRNMLTGHAPLGSGCTSDSDCAAVGEGAYPSCFRPGGVGDGVCAKTVVSTDGSCGFFVDDLELRACPEDRYCKAQPNSTPDEGAQGKARFDVRGSCQPFAKVGQPCGMVEGSDEIVPCEKGLACQYTGAEQPVCAQLKSKGQPCTSHSECAEGLVCNAQTFLCDDPQGGVPTGPGPFCYFGGNDSTDGGAEDSGPSCLSGGASCEAGVECCSGSCVGGVCQGGSECVEDGQFCTMNLNCCSGTCTDNVCGQATACVPQYGQCATTDDCCNGYVCDTGMCL